VKNENVHMQDLHHKLDVLVQIMPYYCSETDYSFCEDSPPAGLHSLPWCRFHPHTPLALPHYCFRSAAPGQQSVSVSGAVCLSAVDTWLVSVCVCVCVFVIKWQCHTVCLSTISRIVLRNSQFKTVFTDDSVYITTLKQQISKRWCYLAAHRQGVDK